MAYAQGKKNERPNVNIIYSDDQGYADLNIYGSKEKLNEEGYFLVNIEKDPSEKNNLAETNVAVVKRLYNKYNTWIQHVEDQE